MKVTFRWPDREGGKDFSFKINAFRGVYDVFVDGIAATKIDQGVFQFYDKETDKKRKIEIINEMMDNPIVNIDNKPLELFNPTPIGVRFMIFIPLLSVIFMKAIGIVIGLIGVWFASFVNRRLKNTFVRIIVLTIIGLVFLVGSYFLADQWAARGWWYPGKNRNTSATAAMLFNLLRK